MSECICSYRDIQNIYLPIFILIYLFAQVPFLEIQNNFSPPRFFFIGRFELHTSVSIKHPFWCHSPLKILFTQKPLLEYKTLTSGSYSCVSVKTPQTRWLFSIYIYIYIYIYIWTGVAFVCPRSCVQLTQLQQWCQRLFMLWRISYCVHSKRFFSSFFFQSGAPRSFS